MKKSAAIFCLSLFALATLPVSADEKTPDEPKTKPLKSLVGKKLLVGSPAFTEGGGPKFESGAKNIAIHYPQGNFKPCPSYFVTTVELEAPLQQEQIDACQAFWKKHPSEYSPTIVVEVLECDMTDLEHPKTKVRFLGAAHYPKGLQTFTDADLKDQPYLPLSGTKQKAE